MTGGETYETLKCLGCDNIKLRFTAWDSDSEGKRIYYFPPATNRSKPKWMFYDLWAVSTQEDKFVEELLDEIYVALHQDLSRLATMGVRSLLERIMISKTDDQGTFSKNLSKFESLGYVSNIQRERLEVILEAGHAAIHRPYTPSAQDVNTLLDITEHIVEAIYIHGEKVADLRKSIPRRRPRGDG